jgi:hypothetical protein
MRTVGAAFRATKRPSSRSTLTLQKPTHNSQLISLQAKQNSESVGQRALIGESVANCVSRPPPQKWQLVKVAIDEPREKT